MNTNRKTKNVDIMSVKSLLGMDLFIPSYQRPYKWTDKNIADILDDIGNAIIDAEKYREFKYRIYLNAASCSTNLSLNVNLLTKTLTANGA